MKRYRRKQKMTRHHLIPRVRGGDYSPQNILYLPREKHDAWHSLFGIFTLDEAIAYLREIKRRQAELAV